MPTWFWECGEDEWFLSTCSPTPVRGCAEGKKVMCDQIYGFIFSFQSNSASTECSMEEAVAKVSGIQSSEIDCAVRKIMSTMRKGRRIKGIIEKGKHFLPFLYGKSAHKWLSRERKMPECLWNQEKYQVSYRNMANYLEGQSECCWTESREAEIQRTVHFIHGWWMGTFNSFSLSTKRRPHCLIKLPQDRNTISLPFSLSLFTTTN